MYYELMGFDTNSHIWLKYVYEIEENDKVIA